MLVLELAANPVWATTSREERLAILVSGLAFLFREFLGSMSKFTLFSVATEADLNPIFAELSLVLGLVLVLL